MIGLKAKAAWSGQRSCWRLDIQYRTADGAPKRTFVRVPDANDKVKGEAAASRAAKDFNKGLGALYEAFVAGVGGTTTKAKPKPLPSPMKTRKEPTMAWLFAQCLDHREIWGKVKHSKNYISGVAKLNTMIGDRPCSDFEPPNGRAIVNDVVKALRADDYSDGYVRKIVGHLRQALEALIGKGVSEAIVHPVTGVPLLTDIPTFPSLPKSPARTAVLAREHDEILFRIMGERMVKAREEERAYGEKHGLVHELGIGAHGNVEIGGETVWLNPKRFSSTQWRVFRDYIGFLLETGCRLSEALTTGNHSIRTREVTADDGSVSDTYQVLHLPAGVTKGDRERFINLSPKLLDGMKLWQATAKPHTVEIGDRTIEVAKAWFPLTKNQVSLLWGHVRTDAKAFGVDLSEISPHNLRHTHATRMSERGMSGKGLQDSLGHKDARTTQIYDHAQSVDQTRKYFVRAVSGGANPSPAET